MLAEKLRGAASHVERDLAIVPGAGQEQEFLHAGRRLEEALALRQRDKSVAIAVSDEERPAAGIDLGEAVETIANEQAGGKNAIFRLPHVRHGGEGLEKHEAAVRPTPGQMHRHAAAQRLPEQDDALAGHACRQPFISGIGRGVTAGLLMCLPPCRNR